MDPYLKSISDVETEDIAQTKGNKKVYFWHIWISEGYRAGLSSKSEMTWEIKEKRPVWYLTAIRKWGPKESSSTHAGAGITESSLWAQRENTGPS